MVEKIVSQVQFEVKQIDRLLDMYSGLLERSQEDEPDLVEITALASVLHSFYNGLENIFLIVAKGVDADVPTGAQWHRDLLTQMTEATSDRKPVLSVQTARRLADYLGFRHFYRHSYSFFLDWSEMDDLVGLLPDVWQQTKREILSFLGNLNSSSEDTYG